jgi:hypothetical protein
MTISRLWLSMLLALLASCGGGEGAPRDAAQAPRPLIEVQLSGTDAGDVILETAAFWMSKAALVDDRSAEESKVKIEDRLLDLRASVTLELPETPPALYSGLRMDFDQPDKDLPPQPELGGMPLSVRLTGRTRAGTAFELRDRQEIKLELRAAEAIDLGPTSRLVAVVRLDSSQWFAGVTIPAPPAGGPVVIDAKDSLKPFEDNLAHSASLTFNPPDSR